MDVGPEGPFGILPVDKAEGGTSHDVVARARRGIGLRRIGHTGTLDPFATGLLLLCLGPATRLAEYFHPLPKRYRAVLRLGTSTDTDDRTGEIVSRSDEWRDLPETEVLAALASQIGETEQVPPRFSAKKVGGERLHKAAREGRDLSAAAVRVTIHAIEVDRIDLPDVGFAVSCSTGTYIRAIARDVGAALGVGGHLVSLRREGIGDFEVAHALPEEILDDRDAALAGVVDPATALAFMPRHTLDAEDARRVAAGNRIADASHLSVKGPVLLLDPSGALLAVADRTEDGLQPRKVFV